MQRTFFRDFDMDGYGDAALPLTATCRPQGYVSDATDCDPASAAVNPGAMETACTPTADEDCDGDLLEGCTSCQQLASLGVTQSGLYALHLPGEPLPVTLSCVMDAGQGFTLIQRTLWDWQRTRVLMTETTPFMEQTVGSASEGPYRLAGRHWPALHAGGVVRVDAWPRVLAPANVERCGRITTVETTGQMTLVNGLPALPAPGVLFIGARVSTVNQDQDTHPQSCVGLNAVPFFYGYCCHTCPTFGGGYWPVNVAHPMMFHTLIESRLASACSGATVVYTPSRTDAGRFIGLDTMEVYLR